MGIFAAIVSGAVLILSFIPSSPVYVGPLDIKMFFAWLVIGIILYLCCAGQRKAMPQAEREAAMFENASEE